MKMENRTAAQITSEAVNRKDNAQGIAPEEISDAEARKLVERWEQLSVEEEVLPAWGKAAVIAEFFTHPVWVREIGADPDSPADKKADVLPARIAVCYGAAMYALGKMDAQEEAAKTHKSKQSRAGLFSQMDTWRLNPYLRRLFNDRG